MERRPDAWGEFLRRTMLTIGLAGVAAVPPGPAAADRGAELGEPDAAGTTDLPAPQQELPTKG
ncbi:hypothetical protein JYK14_18070 [Siccirubricoccus sp. KC 17139]|uniref:Uncharacterized protein n=1 Tax=Siccirubricoccus soli TaxID=2899147 RepID=A0ABT1D810_9PROT|nr:hypothetical protein [Siccirubricoccus soli]MCO6418053.1 hypothetical protein [Siccirubricoccus soli]MCP2684188.1 hypothetical protein [Siccirubricoccus soli]